MVSEESGLRKTLAMCPCVRLHTMPHYELDRSPSDRLAMSFRNSCHICDRHDFFLKLKSPAIYKNMHMHVDMYTCIRTHVFMCKLMYNIHM
jgi:hypothetical protein